jgi:long-chain acyl-CoA synthetase
MRSTIAQVSSNFAAGIASTAGRLAGRPAIERVTPSGLETTTYGDLMADAQRIAGWLGQQFGKPFSGERAAILADNSAHWISAHLGVLWSGGVAVPLDTAYKAAQVRTVLADSGARVLFTSTRYLATARTAVEGLPVTLALIEGDAEGLANFATVRAADAAATPAEVAPGDGAVMLYTSGTTADPKGVVLTHGNLEAERAAALAIIDAGEADAVLGVLPLFHALAQMANLLLPLTVGARVVFLETVSSATLLDALTARGITIFACVPQFFYLIHQRVTAEVAKGGGLRTRVFRTMLAVNRMCRDRFGWNPGRRWFARVHTRLGPKMRILITGGSRFDEAIARDMYALGFTILNAYGLTETSGGASVQRPGDRFTTSVGKALPGIEIRIGPAAAEASEHGDGEVLIRGPIVMREYFGKTEATRAAIDTDGWLHTGDLGRLDADGRLYITGRQKEIIVLSSGKNLYPEEIEAHYRQSPFINELCVMGLSRPGEPAAERLHAVIVPNAEAMRARGIVNIGDAIRFDIETWSARTPAHKRILSYDISTEPLLRTTTGKLKRHELEKLARARAEAKATAADRPIDAAAREWMADTRVGPLVAAMAGKLDGHTIHPDDNLELDLSLDSMERVELLTLLERQAGTSVPADARATIFTARQLVDAVLAGVPTPSADGTSSSDPPWATLLSAPLDPALERQLGRTRLVSVVLLSAVFRTAALTLQLFVRLRVTGREHLPRSGAFLVCPNHQTFIDGFMLSTTLPIRVVDRMFYVGASELFETPASQWFARLINLVPIDPDAHLVDAMQAGAAGLRLGKILLLFPEGERTIDGELKRFRKGAAILAGTLGVPIVPVSLTGFYPLWPRARPIAWHAFWPPRRRTLTITFGEPIRVSPGDEATATERLRGAVARQMAESGGSADSPQSF